MLPMRPAPTPRLPRRLLIAVILGRGDGLSQQQCQPMDSKVAQAASPPSSYMAKPKQ